MSQNKVLDGLFGVCVGDALGLPVEFQPREERDKDPVKEMRGYGMFFQPAGTWSDDSSLTFCLAESLCKQSSIGYTAILKDIAVNFVKWYDQGYWTASEKLPYIKVTEKRIDIGEIVKKAILALKNGATPEEAGLTSRTENGNGSLMRILPMVFYTKDMPVRERFEKVRYVSSITHAHIESVISCQIYNEVLKNILEGDDIRTAYDKMKPVVQDYYKKQGQEHELETFDRISEQDISKIPKDKIFSRSYVLDSLEAALWCNLNHDNYKDTVIEAVNLGWDTDTNGAITGGIAGLYYGFENIPQEWVYQIARKKDIEDLAERLNNATKDI